MPLQFTRAHAIVAALCLGVPTVVLARGDSVPPTAPPGPPEPANQPTDEGARQPPGEPPELLCPDDIRAITRQVISDAETRSSLTPGTAGYDGAFFIASPDRSFMLRFGGYTQFRYNLNFREDGDDGKSTFESGFNVERLRLIFTGHIADPKLEFLLLPYTGSNGTWSILDAWTRYSFGNGWNIKFGQAKLPFNQEYLVSERFLMSAERSIVNQAFTASYGQEIEICNTGDDLAFHVSFNNGIRTLKQDFTSPKVADYGVTSRVQIKFAGQWKQFFEFTAQGNTEPAAMLGFAIHNQGYTGNFGGKEIHSLTQYTADFTYEGLDWSVFTAFIGRNVVIVDEGTRNDYGVVVQGALLVTDDVELFSRYSLLIPEHNVERNNLFNAVTAGVNWYWHGQAAKLTFDTIWYPDPTTDTEILGFGPSESIGLLPSSRSNQVALQLQFQLIF